MAKKSKKTVKKAEVVAPVPIKGIACTQCGADTDKKRIISLGQGRDVCPKCYRG